VAVLETPVPAVDADADGSYSIGDIPENTGYEALAYGVPTYGAAYASLDVQGNAITGWSPVLVDATTFEANNGGFTPTSEWQWGAAGSPPLAFSGTNVWATKLRAFYGDNVTSILTSPVFDVSEATQIFLSFHHWYWVEPEDGGQVQVWSESESRWVVVQPIGGYPDESILVLGSTGGYNGYTNSGYVPAIFDLSDFAGGDLRFRFYFRSDFSGHRLGWYLDDVALDTGQGSTVSIGDLPVIAAAAQLRVVSAGPNPTAGASVLRFSLGSASRVAFTIVDAAGQRLHDERRHFEAGTHELRWHGTASLGGSAPTGVFFYRLSTGSDEIAGRWVRIR
jgi:hypothetical protein